MRIMLDTNVLISAALLSSPHIVRLINEISERHTVVLSTYILDELKRVTRLKFPGKHDLLEIFLRELPFELAYTPALPLPQTLVRQYRRSLHCPKSASLFLL